jgi:hypothetical protein
MIRETIVGNKYFSFIMIGVLALVISLISTKGLIEEQKVVARKKLMMHGKQIEVQKKKPLKKKPSLSVFSKEKRGNQ